MKMAAWTGGLFHACATRIARLLTLLWQLRDSVHVAGYRAGPSLACGSAHIPHCSLDVWSMSTNKCNPVCQPILVGVQFRSGFCHLRSSLGCGIL